MAILARHCPRAALKGMMMMSTAPSHDRQRGAARNFARRRRQEACRRRRKLVLWRAAAAEAKGPQLRQAGSHFARLQGRRQGRAADGVPSVRQGGARRHGLPGAAASGREPNRDDLAIEYVSHCVWACASILCVCGITKFLYSKRILSL